MTATKKCFAIARALSSLCTKLPIPRFVILDGSSLSIKGYQGRKSLSLSNNGKFLNEKVLKRPSKVIRVFLAFTPSMTAMLPLSRVCKKWSIISLTEIGDSSDARISIIRYPWKSYEDTPLTTWDDSGIHWHKCSWEGSIDHARSLFETPGMLFRWGGVGLF